MSIGVENKDSSYWIIKPDVALGPATGKVPPQEHLNPNLISFEITEEMGKMKQGTLSLYDPSGLFSTFLKSGVPFKIFWGYSRIPALEIVAGALSSPSNANGSMARAMTCQALSPSGAGGPNGVVTYNATFYAWEYAKVGDERSWDLLSKQDMVKAILRLDLNVTDPLMFFDWTKGISDIIPQERPIRQTGKPFTWLQELAAKESCFFDLGYNSDGLPVVLWVDKGKIDNTATALYTKAVANSLGGVMAEFAYNRPGSSVNDVASFSWSQNVGENGSGDNIQIMINSATGKPMFIHSVAGQQVITVYELDTGAIEKYEKYIQSKGGAVGLVADVSRLVAADFNTYLSKGFLKAKQFSTAPEGFGFRISLELPTGNPAIVPGMIAKFYGGFPGAFTGTWNTYYVNKVVHKFTGGRYSQSIEVADCFTITGGSLLPAFKGTA